VERLCEQRRRAADKREDEDCSGGRGNEERGGIREMKGEKKAEF
jgi:hypothetical protein